MKKLFPEQLDRLQYFIRLLVFSFIIMSALVFAVFPLFSNKNANGICLAFIVLFPLALLRIPCLDIPRLRNMGWSPWLALLFIVPLANFVMQLLLLFVPPKQSDAARPPLLESQSPDWIRRHWKWLVPILCLAILACFVGGVASIVNSMKSSGAYSGSLSRAKSNSKVIAALGTPIKDGIFVSGIISQSGSEGGANLVFPISGPNGSANVYVFASKSSDKWSFDKLVVQIDRTHEQINLLETNQETKQFHMLTTIPPTDASTNRNH